MNFIFHVIAAMASLALADFDPSSGSASVPMWRTVLLAVLIVSPYLLARVAQSLAIKGRFRIAFFLERVFVLSPIVVQAVAVGLLGWLTTLESWTGIRTDLGAWPGLEMLLALVPFLLAEVCAIDAGARLHAAGSDAIAKFRRFQLRFLVSALAPFVLYLALSGVIGANELWRVSIEEIEAISAASTVVMLALFVLTIPWVLSKTWDTVPLPEGPLRELLETLARGAGFRCRALLVWRTEAQMANAAIVGFTPGSRVVLFSDVLLRMLQPLEVAAVFGHEMGHARRKHAAIFASYTLAVLLAAEALASKYGADDPTLALTIFGAGVVFWFVSFTHLSRRFELEADLESLALMGHSLPLTNALRQVAGGRSFSKSSWRHFSTRQRIEFLHRVERDPRVGEALRRKLARWSRVGYLMLAVMLVVHGKRLADGWDEDHLIADLRLGRYEEAAARLATIDASELSEDRIEPLVAYAVTLDAEERHGAALVDRAFDAFVRGDEQETVDLLELAYLRDYDGVDALIRAIEARDEGEVDTRAEEGLADRWRAAIAERYGGRL